MTRYLSVDDVISINEAEVGAQNTLVDFGLLESAILRPQQSVMGQDAYPSVHGKAAALLHSLIRNHPFVDGNKRTGVLATLIFYGMNGLWLDMEQGEMVALGLDVAEGILTVEQIEARLKDRATAIEMPGEDFEG